jgi:hypothetical protein
MKKILIPLGIFLLISLAFLAFPTRTGAIGRVLHIIDQAVTEVAKSTTSSEQSVTLVESRVIITYIAVDSSASDDFDLQVYNQTSGTHNTIDLKYEYTTADRFFSVADFGGDGLTFINRDTTELKKLYFKIKNDDSVNNSTFNILIHYFDPRVR